MARNDASLSFFAVAGDQATNMKSCGLNFGLSRTQGS